MGRGRQKAKQTKVARALKYSTYEPNLHALEQELTSGGGGDVVTDESDRDDDGDDYAPWVREDR